MNNIKNNNNNKKNKNKNQDSDYSFFFTSSSSSSSSSLSFQNNNNQNNYYYTSKNYQQKTKLNLLQQQQYEMNNFQKLEFMVKSLEKGILNHSLYSPQLYQFFKQIRNKRSIYVLKAEDLFDNTATTMKDITQFLQLDAINWSKIVKKKYNMGYETGNETSIGIKAEDNQITIHHINKHTKFILQQFFEPYNKQVGKFMSDLKWKKEGKSPWEYKDDDFDQQDDSW